MKSCIYFGSVSHMPVYSQIPQNLHFLRHSCLSDSLCCFFCLSYFLTPCCLLLLRLSGIWPFLLALGLARVVKRLLPNSLTVGPMPCTAKVGGAFLPSICLHPSRCKKNGKCNCGQHHNHKTKKGDEPCLVAGYS